jgi:hypothetical protein
MYQKKSKILHLIFCLSILCKNIDIVQYLYNYIKNDYLKTLNYNHSFHICLSFHNNLLYSKYITRIDNDFYYLSPFKKPAYHYWKPFRGLDAHNSLELLAHPEPIKLFSLDDNYHFHFYNSDIYYSIITNKFLGHLPGDRGITSLDRYVRKISLISLKLKNFILIKDDNIYYEPSLSQKIKTINNIIKYRSTNYFITIFQEFKHGDLYDCIILQKNNDIDTILGGKF